MNWFTSNNKSLEDRIYFLEERIATSMNPNIFKVGDTAWLLKWTNNTEHHYVKVIIVELRSVFRRGHACLYRDNNYLVLNNDRSHEVNEDYLYKTKPKQSKLK